MKIQKTSGKITAVRDIGESAREIIIMLTDGIDILPGCFINIFIPIDGEVQRRAYSIASDYKNKKEVTIAVRKKEGGKVSPYFWSDDIIGTEFEVMGPLGLNTIDKMHSKKVFLVGYGIGVSVIKALVYGLQDNLSIKEIHIITGNRDEYDILYREFFDNVTQGDIRFSVRYIVAHSHNDTYPYIGFAQEHIADYDFTDADVYVCGQEIACDGLVKRVQTQTKDMRNTTFFIEAFH